MMLHVRDLARLEAEAARDRDTPLMIDLVAAVSNLSYRQRSTPLEWQQSEELLEFLRASDALTCTDAHAERIAELEALFAEGLAA